MTSSAATAPAPGKAVLPPGLITAAELDAQTFPAIPFVVEGLLPQGIGMLVAKPKMGKSFMSLDLSLAVANGRPFIGRKTAKGSVLYLALEDNLRRLQARERWLRGNGSPVNTLHFGIEAPEIGAGLEQLITNWADYVGDGTLVIIDTMGRVMPQSRGNDDYAHATKTLGKLQTVAFEHELSILLIHHAKKQDEVRDPFELALGSQGLFGVLDVMLVLDRPRMGSGATLYVTGRDIEESQHAIHFDKTTGLWYATEVSPVQQLNVTPERLNVLDAIHKGTTKTGGIADALNTTSGNISNMLKKLEEEGHVRKVKHGLYELTDNTRHVLEQVGESSESGELGPHNAVRNEVSSTDSDNENGVNIDVIPETQKEAPPEFIW